MSANAKILLRVAFRSALIVYDKHGDRPLKRDEDFEMMVVQVKQEILYNPQLVEIFRTDGLTEHTARILIDQTMEEVMDEYFSGRLIPTKEVKPAEPKLKANTPSIAAGCTKVRLKGTCKEVVEEPVKKPKKKKGAKE